MRKTTFFITLITVILIIGCNQKTNKPVKEKKQETRQNPVITRIAELKAAGYEIIDYHAHLKGGLSMEELLEPPTMGVALRGHLIRE